MALSAPPVQVRLANGAQSGLANIVYQYLEQDLAEFERKRRQAFRLHGRIAMTASDHEASATIEFRGAEVVIWDGERAPLDASIVGPYRSLVRLLQGESHPLLEHLRGHLRVRSSLRRPLFPFHVHNLMKLPPPEGAVQRGRQYALAAAATAAVLAAGVAVVYLTK